MLKQFTHYVANLVGLFDNMTLSKVIKSSPLASIANKKKKQLT